MGIAGICPRCKTEKPVLGIFKFKYKDLWLRIFCDGVICRNCTKEEIIDDFEEYAGELIKKTENQKVVSINWDYYKKIPIGKNHFKINQFLESLGVLSFKSNGNYEIVDGAGHCCNPKASFTDNSFLFFREENHVLDYVLQVLSPQIENWDWEIRKIIKTIDHNDFALKTRS